MSDHGFLYDLLREIGLSDFASTALEFALVRPLKILLIALVAFILTRIGSRAICRSVKAIQRRSPLIVESARSESRATTVGDVLANLFRVVVWVVAAMVMLDEVGVNLAPLLAGAGIAGLAVGFGAQTLVRDVISGLFILVEDQFGIGDTVTLGDVTGTVEDLNLRTTRVRSVDGTVWFVPNGEVRKVGNASLGWARAIVDVPVPVGADVSRIEHALREEADAMAAEAEWAESFLEPPEVQGVQVLANDSVTVRLVGKVAPERQTAVARELRGRVNSRLTREGLRKVS